MNKLCILLSFNIILIILSILFKKNLLLLYSLIFIFLFSLTIFFKVNSSVEGMDIEEIGIEELNKANDLLNKLISMFNVNRQNCLGEYVPQKCERTCGFSTRDKIYTITQQKGDKGLPCPHKEGKVIKEECIDKTCGSGEFCLENRDCKSETCNDVSLECEKVFECDIGDQLEFCESDDECISLNTKYDLANITYEWDGYTCSGKNTSNASNASNVDSDSNILLYTIEEAAENDDDDQSLIPSARVLPAIQAEDRHSVYEFWGG